MCLFIGEVAQLDRAPLITQNHLYEMIQQPYRKCLRSRMSRVQVPSSPLHTKYQRKEEKNE